MRAPNEADVPPAPHPVAASTSHAGHSAGRLMPEPPGSDLQSHPRAPPSLQWPGMPPGHVLYVSEIRGLYVTLSVTFVKEMVHYRRQNSGVASQV